MYTNTEAPKGSSTAQHHTAAALPPKTMCTTLAPLRPGAVPEAAAGTVSDPRIKKNFRYVS